MLCPDICHSPTTLPTTILTLGIASRGKHSYGPTFSHLGGVSGNRLSHRRGAENGWGEEAVNEEKIPATLLHSVCGAREPLRFKSACLLWKVISAAKVRSWTILLADKWGTWFDMHIGTKIHTVWPLIFSITLVFFHYKDTYIYIYKDMFQNSGGKLQTDPSNSSTIAQGPTVCVYPAWCLFLNFLDIFFRMFLSCWWTA